MTDKPRLTDEEIDRHLLLTKGMPLHGRARQIITQLRAALRSCEAKLDIATTLAAEQQQAKFKLMEKRHD